MTSQYSLYSFNPEFVLYKVCYKTNVLVSARTYLKMEQYFQIPTSVCCLPLSLNSTCWQQVVKLAKNKLISNVSIKATINSVHNSVDLAN